MTELIEKYREHGTKEGYVKKVSPGKMNGEIIGKIASSYYYTHENTLIENLAEEMISDEEMYTVAIVDSDRKVKGIVARNKLFDLLSKPFGRELYIRKAVKLVGTTVEQIFEKKSIFSIADKISDRMSPDKLIHYVLTNERGQFNGIFSSRDLLYYLSEITKQDITLAKRLQSAIVRDAYEAETDKTRIIGCSKMAKGLGGDYYALKKIDDNRWMFMLADVSGKGVAASLISVTLGGMMSIYDFSKGIRDFILSINDYIFSSFEAGRFLTGIFGEYNEVDGKVVMYDMGHSYSYLYRSGRVSQIKSAATNIPLGIRSDLDPVSTSLTLAQDDVLLFISDGIEEQSDVNDEQYGIARFMRLVMGNLNETAQMLHKKIFSDIKTFRKGQAIGDDMTFVILQKK